MNDSIVLVWIVLGVAGVFGPAYLASHLGRTRAVGAGAGFVFGLFLNVGGVLIVLAYPPRGETRKCPRCAERVKADARVCKHCGGALAEDDPRLPVNRGRRS